MLAEKRRGGIMFTSSAAAVMPSPFVCLYGATKAFLSSFGASLAAEV
jgi:short-subunit dehydrogenase